MEEEEEEEEEDAAMVEGSRLARRRRGRFSRRQGRRSVGRLAEPDQGVGAQLAAIAAMGDSK